jgi:hypothetical protein
VPVEVLGLGLRAAERAKRRRRQHRRSGDGGRIFPGLLPRAVFLSRNPLHGGPGGGPRTR